ncbi:MAG: hypothetical protein LAO20_22865 [Acidobacteriia bacterium]|nr:hypothetical protein [Terriglobia bacterium]
MTNQDAINLVRNATLWPADEVVRYARVWLKGAGSEFLNLPASQTQTFWQCVAGAGTVEQFDDALRKFSGGVEKRGKRNTPWARATGKPLTQSLAEALANVAQEVTRDDSDPHNQAYEKAREMLGNDCPSRDLAVRKAFLKTLLLMHRCQDHYPFHQEEL